MKPISLLIFDLDGTLADTLEDMTASVNHTLRRLGKAPLSADRVRRYVGDGIEMLLTRSLGGSEGLAEATAIYMEHHRRNLVVHSRLYPAVGETLEYFKSLPMGVITNKAREFSEPLLKRLGIRNYFNLVIGADDGLPLKPAPDSLQKIMETLHVPREHTAIVGDGTTDVRAGKAAGVTTCSVAYGFRPEDELRSAGPDYLIHAFPELRNIFLAKG